MPKLTIDGQEIEVAPGTTILQACQQAGVEIPHFCYHERLMIAGNCRMCLVEVERSPKPVASCAMPVADGNVIHTQSEKARKARHGVMEMLLLNHPLDCPICDQGGECDLQDQAMAYGYDRGRGEAMEITTYIEKALGSELSANIVDLCPVGALTSKPYSYVARPWELRKTESVDVFDAVGSNIRIDSRGAQILRVLPRLHEDVNEEWISDKTRFAIDGLVRRRLDRPYVRRNGKLVEAEWQEALDLVADRLKGAPGERIAAIAGDLCDAEAMYALKELLAGLGASSLDCRQDGARVDPGCRAGYLFNTTIAGIDRADACLLLGTNPRWEAPLVNARLRKRYLRGGFRVAAIGPAHDLTFPVERLGAGGETLSALARGEGAWAELLRAAKAPMIVLGQGALARPDGGRVLAAGQAIANRFGQGR